MPPFHAYSLTLVNPKNGRPAGMISDETYAIVKEHSAALDSAVVYARDFHYNLCVTNVRAEFFRC